MKRAGVIGIGNMGSGLAKNLIANGFATCGYDIDADKLEALSSMGGQVCHSYAEVAQNADIVFVMVMTGDQAKDVILSEQGLVKHLPENGVVVLSATVKPREAKEIAGAMQNSSVRLIDSPVSGGFPGAQSGTLTLMLAAKTEVLEECRPVLNAVSKSIHHVGEEGGQGQTVKACLQAIIGGMFSATFEAAALAAKAGVPGEVLFNVVSTSSAGNTITNTSLENIIDRKFAGTGSHIDTMHKDLTISLNLGEELGVPLYTAAAAMQLFHAGRSKLNQTREHCVSSPIASPSFSTHQAVGAGFFDETSCCLDDFRAIIDDSLSPAAVPHANAVVHNIPLYNAVELRAVVADNTQRTKLMAEWGDVLLNRSGVVVIKQAYTDLAMLDAVTDVYLKLIADEKATNSSTADHFAAAGSNDRLWNSLQKLAKADANLYVKYFANTSIDAVCESWLGPNYQMTAQINLVYPGGQAQRPHRDYHLGFQSNASCARYPQHVHALSPALTLQGGIAHCDMSIDSGVTQLLPFSQRYLAGYLAYRRDDFQQLFAENFIQLPLEKGDAFFFNPALFHAAGDNRTDNVNRLANLLQVSSAFGIAMETIDRRAMCEWVYPALQREQLNNTLTPAEVQAVIAATGDGYSFPTSLDTDPPVGGLAPETQQQLMSRCLLDGLSAAEFSAKMSALMDKRRA